MNIRFYLYFLIVPLTIWSLLSLNLEKYFKKGHVNQIKVFYILITFAISYLVVNFLYDFYLVSKF
ncbi:MAG: DUF1146 domain-containing protein [Bacilli bacterium]|nr:DUF1146 domain-containing protein [Bacilli bacterium]